MAEKHDKKADAKPEGEATEAKKGGLLTKLPVLLGGTMVIEAVLIIGVVKFLGVGSKPAKADTEIASAEGTEKGAEKKDAADSEKKDGAAEGEKAEKGDKPEGEGKGEKPEAKTEGKEEGKGEEKGKTEAKSKVPKSPFAEIELTTFRAPNAVSGHRIVYDLAIYARVKRVNEDKMKAFVRDRKATVEDRVRTIIATLDPEKLGGGTEPGLETLRRQVKFALEEVVGEGVVEEVLVPRCLPYRGE